MKKKIAAALVMCMVLGLTACGTNGAGGSGEDTKKEDTKSGESAEIQVIPMSTASAYWLAVKQGAEDAAADLKDEYGDILVKYDGPPKNGDATGQIDIMNNAVTAQVDGIVLAATDPEALLEPVKNAIAEGVHVVTVDSGVEPNEADSFFYTNNIEGCKKLGEYMLEDLGKDTKGSYAIIGDSYEFAAGKDRPDGFEQAMTENPDMEYLGIQLAKSDIAEAENICSNFLTANPDLDLIFATNDAAAQGALNAFNKAGITSEVKLCVVDVSEDVLTAMEKGIIDAAALQNPYTMGYEGVVSIMKLLNGETVEKQVDTGVFILTPENMKTEEAVKAIQQYLPDYQP